MAPDSEKIDLVHFQTVVSLGDVDEIANWKKEERPDIYNRFKKNQEINN